MRVNTEHQIDDIAYCAHIIGEGDFRTLIASITCIFYDSIDIVYRNAIQC